MLRSEIDKFLYLLLLKTIGLQTNIHEGFTHK